MCGRYKGGTDLSRVVLNVSGTVTLVAVRRHPDRTNKTDKTIVPSFRKRHRDGGNRPVAVVRREGTRERRNSVSFAPGSGERSVYNIEFFWSGYCVRRVVYLNKEKRAGRAFRSIKRRAFSFFFIPPPSLFSTPSLAIPSLFSFARAHPFSIVFSLSSRSSRSVRTDGRGACRVRAEGFSLGRPKSSRSTPPSTQKRGVEGEKTGTTCTERMREKKHRGGNGRGFGERGRGGFRLVRRARRGWRRSSVVVAVRSPPRASTRVIATRKTGSNSNNGILSSFYFYFT